MRLRHIEVFHAVYTTGSVTRAAKLLSVSQPSVSKVLSHAEIQLGFKLFERGGGRFLPTAEAERLFHHVNPLFDQIGAVRRVADNLRDLGENKIRLASTPAMGISLIPELVSSFMSAHPGVHFELETLHYTEIAAALIESRLDVALVFDPPSQPDVLATPIASGEFVFIKPANMNAVASPVDLPSIGNLPFVRLNNRGPLGQLLDAYLEKSESTIDVVATTETYHIAHALVARGVGVSIVDAITAQALDDAAVEILPLKHPLQFNVAAVEFEHAAASDMRLRFIEHARSTVQTLLTS